LIMAQIERWRHA